jgi:branched-chain amino acid transport system permease protein
MLHATSKRSRIGGLGPWLIFVIALILFGLRGPFALSVATVTLLFAALALGLNMTMGYAGLVNVGVGAMYGAGAYAAAILATRTSVPFVAILVVVPFIVAALALIIAPLVLRTRGLHFAVATLALGLISTQIFTNWTSLTGGPLGIAGINRPSLLAGNGAIYALVAVSTVAILVIAARFHRSRTAIVLRGVRDDEQLTRSLGYRVNVYKIASFVLGSAVAGFVGVLYAYFIQYVSPDAFDLQTASFEAFVIVAFGGAGTVWGPIVGSTLLVGLPSFIHMSPELQILAYGAAIIIVIVLLPEGVAPGAYRLAKALLGGRSAGEQRLISARIQAVRRR